MSHTDQETSSDEGPFETVATTEATTQERILSIIDTWVIAPLLIIFNDLRGLVGFSIILLYVLMGTVGVVIIPQPTAKAPILLQPFESIAYPLGTDKRGQGILRLVVHATPPMLKMILAGAVFSTSVATLVGTLSGYKGGIVDKILSTFADIVLTLPGLPLVMLVAIIFEPRNPFLVGFVLTINAWGGLARAIRSQVLTLREEPYVEASRVIGVPTHSILRDDIIPNIMPYVAVSFVNTARSVIFSSVGLYFLGILPFSNENWGVMINQAFGWGAIYDPSAVHWLMIPIIVVSLISLGFMLTAQSLDKIFNPRIKARHQRKGESIRESEEEPEVTEFAFE